MHISINYVVTLYLFLSRSKFIRYIQLHYTAGSVNVGSSLSVGLRIHQDSASLLASYIEIYSLRKWLWLICWLWLLHYYSSLVKLLSYVLICTIHDWCYLLISKIMKGALIYILCLYKSDTTAHNAIYYNDNIYSNDNICICS